MKDRVLVNVNQEKDLENFKMSDHCTAASKKASMMIDLTSRKLITNSYR